MGVDADERDLLLARRIKLGVRLVIYPLLLGLIAYAWHVRQAHSDPVAHQDELVTQSIRRAPWDGFWQGEVAPGWRVSVWSEENAPTSLVASVPLRCDDGNTFDFRLTVDFARAERTADGASAIRAVAGSHADDGFPMAWVAHVDAHLSGLPRGALDLTVLWRPPRGATRCRSGRLAFPLATYR